VTPRERLPNRRASIVFELELHGLRYTAGVSHFADGRPAEIFLQNHKPGSQSDANARFRGGGKPSTAIRMPPQNSAGRGAARFARCPINAARRRARLDRGGAMTIRPAGKLTVTCESFHPLVRNTLRGFATIAIADLRLKIHDVAIHQKGEARWAQLPAKPQVRDGALVKDLDTGKIQYVPIMEFDSRTVRDAFSRVVIDACLSSPLQHLRMTEVHNEGRHRHRARLDRA
jgi:hypothetical protein